jgi:hypothetical protein
MIYPVESMIYASFIVAQKKAKTDGAHGPRSREKFSTNNSTGCDAG